MTTPFDTARLDEECERIAAQLVNDPTATYWPLPYQIKAALLGDKERAPTRECCAQIFAICRRPKMVPA